MLPEQWQGANTRLRNSKLEDGTCYHSCVSAKKCSCNIYRQQHTQFIDKCSMERVTHRENMVKYRSCFHMSDERAVGSIPEALFRTPHASADLIIAWCSKIMCRPLYGWCWEALFAAFALALWILIRSLTRCGWITCAVKTICWRPRLQPCGISCDWLPFSGEELKFQKAAIDYVSLIVLLDSGNLDGLLCQERSRLQSELCNWCAPPLQAVLAESDGWFQDKEVRRTEKYVPTEP